MIKKVKSKCTIDPYKILQKSLYMALWCVVGYSIYVDLLYMNYSKSYFGDITTTNFNINKRFVVIALIIVSFVMLIELTGVLFKTNTDECELSPYF
jgi:signal transduction histidine kinase